MAAPDMKLFAASVNAKSEGRFKALISTFGIPDKGGDTVVRGAFGKSLDKWRASNRRIPVIYNHMSDDPLMHVGSVNPHDSQETDQGLVVTGELYLDEERGRKVFAELRRGTLNEWSFGALIQASRPRKDGGRDLVQLDLVEVSPTLLGKGETETLLVANARSASSAVTVEHRLAPHRARLRLAQLREARWRAARVVAFPPSVVPDSE
jgi:HK97 family phage prohead protease